MMYGFKRVIRYILGTDVAGRDMAVYPDDTFIVSYPRSGNTWTRFLIANLLHPEELVTFANIERLIPDSEAQSSRYIKRIPRPRVIKSHAYFDHRYKNVIYIVRDPRDVALSYYNFSRKYRHIDDQYPLTDYVNDFVSGRLSSADWGTWGENVASWFYTHCRRPGFLLLRYEDMIENPERELAKLASFFGIQASPERLTSVAQRSSPERMRSLEKTQAHEWVSTKNKRTDIPFIGSATSGLWKTKLQPISVAAIESAWGSLMRNLGYELMTGQPSTIQEGCALEFQPAVQAAIPGDQI